MIYNIILQTNVILEVKKAFDWYEDTSEGLGYEFIADLENSYKKISIDPERYAYINPRYRRFKLIRFPYFIFYEIEGSDIIVGNVRHIKRRPLYDDQ